MLTVIDHSNTDLMRRCEQQDGLVRLQWDRNPFLRVQGRTMQVSAQLWVELIMTAQVAIDDTCITETGIPLTTFVRQ